MDTCVATFLFGLFSGTTRPTVKKGSLLVDGKNDSLFLKRIQDEFFMKSSNEREFVEKMNSLTEEQEPSILAWARRRQEELKDNFDFVIWSAWKAVMANR